MYAVSLYAESALGTLISLRHAAALTLVAAEQTFFLEIVDQVLLDTLSIDDGRIRMQEEADVSRLVDSQKVTRFAL